MSAARVAGAPITWGVCEVPGWGHQMSAERVFAEMRSLGLDATELGPDAFLPSVAPQELLDAFGLRVVAGFVPAVLHDEARLDEELAAVSAAASTIASLGGEVLVLAASTGRDGYEAEGALDAASWARLARGIDRVIDAAARLGLRVALHPHHGTLVQHPEEIELVLELSEVDLCLDTGHIAVGRGDPVDVARSAGARVKHVHLKDVDGSVARRLADGQIGYRDAVRDGLYRTLGDGDVDVHGVLQAVEESEFDGWYVLEHDAVLAREPDAGAGPLQDARRSLAFLERAWEEVGAATGR